MHRPPAGAVNIFLSIVIVLAVIGAGLLLILFLAAFLTPPFDD